MIDTIKKKALASGTKFMVGPESEDSVLMPYSTGYISSVLGPDNNFPHIIHISAVIIRRGKAGRNRLDWAQLSTPIFDIKDDRFNEMTPPTDKSRCVNIMEQESGASHALEMPVMDFAGWVCAYAHHVNRISTVRGIKPPLWPKRRNMSLLLDLPSIFKDYGIIPELRDPDNRITWPTELRKIELAASKIVVRYIGKVATARWSAANSLLDFASHKSRARHFSLGEIKDLKALSTYYQNTSLALCGATKRKEQLIVVDNYS